MSTLYTNDLIDFALRNKVAPQYVYFFKEKFFSILQIDQCAGFNLLKDKLKIPSDVADKIRELFLSSKPAYNTKKTTYFNDCHKKDLPKTDPIQLENFKKSLDREFELFKNSQETVDVKDVEITKKLTEYVVQLTIDTDYTLNELFNKFQTTANFFFTQYNSIYKLHNSISTHTDLFVSPPPTDTLLFRSVYDEDNIITITSEGKHMYVSYKKTDNTLLTNEVITIHLLDPLQLKLISETKLDYEGYINVKLPSTFPVYNKSIVADLVMNDKTISPLLRYDESNVTTKQKNYIWFLSATDRYKSSISYVKEFVQKTGDNNRYLQFKIYRTIPIDIIDNIIIFGIKKLLVTYKAKYKDVLQIYKPLLHVGDYADMVEEDRSIDIIDINKPFRSFSFYTSNYTRDQCQISRVPTIMSDSEIKDIDPNRVIKFKGINEAKFNNYVCSEPTPYPRLQKNNMSNKDVCPSVPCCFQVKQTQPNKTIKVGVLPEALHDIFHLIDTKYTSYSTKNFNRLNSSLLYCLANATKLSKTDITTQLTSNLNTICQTSPSHPITSLVSTKNLMNCISDQKIETDTSVFIDYKIFGDVLSYIIKHNIYVVDANVNGFVTLNSNYIYYNNENKYPKCIYILQRSKDSGEVYYDLIVKKDQHIFSTSTIHPLYQQLTGTTYIMNTKVGILPTFDPTFQFVDDNGKTRKLQLLYKGNPLTVYTSPTFQYNCPIATIVDTLTPLKTAVKFAEGYKITLTHLLTTKDQVFVANLTGSTYTAIRVDTDKGNTLPVITNFVFDSTMSKKPSKLEQFRQFRQFSAVLSNYILHVFTAVNKPLDVFIKENTIIKPTVVYNMNITTEQFVQPTSFVVNNVFIFKTQELRRRYIQKLELMLSTKVVATTNGLYSYVSDYSYNKKSELLLQTTNYNVINTSTNPYHTTTTVQSTNQPYFISNKLIDDGSIFLAQPASSLSNALTINSNWYKHHYNSGVVQTIDMKPTFTLYSFVNAHTINKYIVTNNKKVVDLSEFVVVGYKQLNIEKYVALLRINPILKINKNVDFLLEDYKQKKETKENKEHKYASDSDRESSDSKSESESDSSDRESSDSESESESESESDEKSNSESESEDEESDEKEHKEGDIGCSDYILMANQRNSCYVDSLLVALFIHKSSFIKNKLLNGEATTKTGNLIIKKLNEIYNGIHSDKGSSCSVNRNELRELLQKYNDKYEDDHIDFVKSPLEPSDVLRIFSTIVPLTTEVKNTRYEITDGKQKIVRNEIDDETINKIIITNDKAFDGDVGKMLKQVKYTKSTLKSKKEIITNMIDVYDYSASKFLVVTLNRHLQEDKVVNGKVKTIRTIDDRVVTFPEKLDGSLELSSIIVHIGSDRGGHYICYFRCENEWYRYDDTTIKITKIGSFTELLKIDGIRTKCTDLVYCAK